MQVPSSTQMAESSSNLPQSVRKICFCKSDFHKSLSSGRISDGGERSDIVNTNLEFIKQLSRFDTGDYVIVTTFKNGKYNETRGRIIGYKKLPNFVMGIQKDGVKRPVNVDLNPCNYGDLSDLEVRRSGPRSWVEILDIETGEVPLHIFKLRSI